MTDLIFQVIKKHLPSNTFISAQSVSGGCINSAFKINTLTGFYFLKLNSESFERMFKTEKNGLEVLAKKSPIHVPRVLGYGVFNSNAYLLTEWIEEGAATPSFWKSFGSKLAKQHQATDHSFGLANDNFIGRLNQSNKQHKYWTAFFINERLIPQVALALSNKLIEKSLSKKFDKLFNKLESLIPEEPPALLHGDLWNGNFLVMNTGESAIFDPAVHYGHRETELAFTKLFGGFDNSFYDHYNHVYPLTPGFTERVDIHNLYPLLVHVNLFGTSYLSGIIQTLNRFA